MNLPVSLAGINTPYGFTVITYLAAHLLIGYLIVIISLLFAFAVGSLIKNQYMGLVASLGIILLMFILSFGAEDKMLTASGILASNPVTLLLNFSREESFININTNKWFVSSTGIFADKNFVLWVTVLWIAVCAVLAAISSRVFRKKDI